MSEIFSTTESDFDGQAAFDIEMRLVSLPEGRFILPLCITREELLELLTEINRVRSWSPIRRYRARDAILQALPYAGSTENPLCTDCDCGNCDDDCQ